MKIALLGYGVEGQSAYEYWSKQGNQITICDLDSSIVVPEGASTKLGPDYLSNLGEFDLIVRSPGLNPKDIVDANSESILTKVTSVMNELFKVCPTKNIIGVTGTKGKGTTATLISKLLEASGHKVHLAGNIGKSAVELLKDNIEPEDWVVLELSSFQLTDLKYSPHIAVCLLIAPEHLNWHDGMSAYLNAKKNIFIHQVSTDIAIYYGDNEYSKDLANASPGKKIAYFRETGASVVNNQITIAGQVICSTSDIKLIGKHNWQNVCAALTAYWQIDQNPQIAREVITNFEGLEHRLELVRRIDDVAYYNDSFASAPDAAIAAMEALPGQKVMIMGGFDRGLDLSPLAGAIQKNQGSIKKVLLIGASAERLAHELQKIKFDNFVLEKSKSIESIVKLASELAKPDALVVLFPGFASFDMFKNFEERGNQYKQAVRSL